MTIRDLAALPYGRVLALDFEFCGPEGDNPRVVCLVIKDVVSGETRRFWADEITPSCMPPFDIGEDTLLLAYFASAEMQCFRTLGWSMPANLVDLYAEFRCETNGDKPPCGNGLIGALTQYGLAAHIPEDKDEMRQLVLDGGPWSDQDKLAIMDYCQRDVEALGPLLAAMLAQKSWSVERLGQALLRGRYMCAVGIIQFNGIPLDSGVLGRIREAWGCIQKGLIDRVNPSFNVYELGSFRDHRFEAFLMDNGIPWPRLPSGKLALDRDTFSSMSKTYPVVRPLHELRKTLGELRLEKLALGPDGRNRTLLAPLQAKTGRNQPSTSKFVFGPAKWIRGLIKPQQGKALAYVDWSSQEIAIAAALSGDKLLWDAYASGDPYIAFAIQAGLAPTGANKQTHKEVRDRCKQVVLGVNYGMAPEGVANAAGIHILEAQNLLQKHRETYRSFWAWAERNMNAGLLGLPLQTCFGWQVRAASGQVKANTFLNWPMQAHGAEMLRLACCLAVERGIKVCAPIHDALLIEADITDIELRVVELRACMDEASELVLGQGKICRTDAEIVRYPDRYMDDGGESMWQVIMELLEAQSEPAGDAFSA